MVRTIVVITALLVGIICLLLLVCTPQRPREVALFSSSYRSLEW